MTVQTEKKFYVYELAYPESMGGSVFYVGKGSKHKTWEKIIDRIDMHEKYARQPLSKIKRMGLNVEKCRVIRSIWANGEQVVKRKVFWTNIEKEAYAYESKLIDKYGINNLTNKPQGCRPLSKSWVVRQKPIEQKTISKTEEIADNLKKPTTMKKSIDPENVEYLSAQEVATRLRVAKRTIIQEIHRGKLEAINVGNVLRIPVVAFNAYLENQKVKPGEEIAEESSEDEAA